MGSEAARLARCTVTQVVGLDSGWTDDTDVDLCWAGMASEKGREVG